MGHRLRLFAGPKAALRPIAAVSPHARAFALTPLASVFVVPLTDDLHDDLHRHNGTGEWLDFNNQMSAPLFTTTDMAFAARASAGSALAWLETNYFGGRGEQIAAVWIGGALHMKPTVMRDDEARHVSLRPASLRPINVAMRLFGIVAASPDQDEFDAFGLGSVLTNEDLVVRAHPVDL
jgi:hypothetical protein